jgi:CTP synthase (UTP-ammonia lyase)
MSRTYPDREPAGLTTLALIGDCDLRKPSHRELNAVRAQLGTDVGTQWVATDSGRMGGLSEFNGIWLAPGSPYADEDAVVEAISWARRNDVPFLGTCSGMQYAVIELFRNVLGESGASHEEAAGRSADNVVTALACSLQGQLRTVRPLAGTRFASLVGGREFDGMHYCSYAPDSQQLKRLTAAGLLIEASADDAGAEVVHWPAARFFYASLFQPQIGASSGAPLHPLVAAFADAARQHRRETLALNTSGS